MIVKIGEREFEVSKGMAIEMLRSLDQVKELSLDIGEVADICADEFRTLADILDAEKFLKHLVWATKETERKEHVHNHKDEC